MIYGNNFNRSQIVRLGEHGNIWHLTASVLSFNKIKFYNLGLLRTIQINDRDFLPLDTKNHSIACAIPPTMPLPENVPRRSCIFAGK